MSAGAAVITLEGVRKEFGDYVAVQPTDLSIAHGEFFSLLGPSGCGKTTTLRMIAGFEQPTAGRLLLSGHDVSRVPAHKRSVNTVFQQYALFPHMTVRQNIAYGLKVKKVPRAELDRRVDAMLTTVHLANLGSRRPSELSGGQQQRVALARALVNEPDALLLDEPLGALDLKLRQAMQFELKRIQQELGLAFVYVTHDQDEALTMSDRIAVMNLGRIEQIGSPTEIYEAPATVFVANFIGQANLWPGAIAPHSAPVAAQASEASYQVNVLGTTIDAVGEPIDATRTTVLVRPERITVIPAETAVPGRSVAVTATGIVFQGPVLRLDSVADDGAAVVAHLGPDAATAHIRPGDRLTLGWAAGAARLVHESVQPIAEAEARA